MPDMIFGLLRASAAYSGDVTVSRTLRYYLLATLAVAVAVDIQALRTLQFAWAGIQEGPLNQASFCSYGVPNLTDEQRAFVSLSVASFLLYYFVTYAFTLYPALKKTLFHGAPFFTLLTRSVFASVLKDLTILGLLLITVSFLPTDHFIVQHSSGCLAHAVGCAVTGNSFLSLRRAVKQGINASDPSLSDLQFATAVPLETLGNEVEDS